MEQDNSLTFMYRFMYNYIFPVLVRLFAWTAEGHEHLPKDQSTKLLFVAYHSSHNWDIMMMSMSIYEAMGAIPKGLVHRSIMACHPWLKMMGCIVGTQENAMNSYNNGQRVCIVIPGGAEEAVAGFENAYTVNWTSSTGRPRTGFAELAINANAVIVPVVIKNQQEMCWNPIFFLANFTRLSKAYNALLNLPYGIGWFLWQLKCFLWFTLSCCFQIPLPVKATLKFGPVCRAQENESGINFARRVEAEYAKLLEFENPGGLNYSRALKERFMKTKEE
ncbi:hypothetical protein THRCLA_10682 [Thraustotheca clavata]|uniref:Phospholipid/glycerol acyltransferase domain-containing protein n=1 Tax=Thraustotheca clavata TaxID=74557 RepID=A0A1V9YIK7_9STRA|nr:hypothetical protein THRCLA_10682 [Thraustotheca clavata]